ncbi:hypothetical protein KIW84_033224 [Lathyrus oleraceus]|uniref:Uncharacterized protein n=1 Tax=Pisum sativum TaxID=3888 RepID=A0A9D5B2V9_PEA|nr:hypothetical protein KIW84_033224 [Pisum sativum]
MKEEDDSVEEKQDESLFLPVVAKSGMAGGMETLCGQAFGAGQFEKLGIYTYTAVISPAMSVLSPMIISSLIGLFFHGVTSWVLVFKLALGSVGTAIAFSSGVWLNVVLLLCLVKYSSACEITRVPFSKKAFLGFKKFYVLAVAFLLLWFGAAKGSGWQRVGAYVNLGAFYLVGIPVGVVLGFIVHFKSGSMDRCLTIIMSK